MKYDKEVGKIRNRQLRLVSACSYFLAQELSTGLDDLILTTAKEVSDNLEALNSTTFGQDFRERLPNLEPLCGSQAASQRSISNHQSPKRLGVVRSSSNTAGVYSFALSSVSDNNVSDDIVIDVDDYD